MSPRRRLRGTGTPPMDRLDDSDSDSEMVLYDDIDLEQQTDIKDTEIRTQSVSSTRDTSTRSAAQHPGLSQTEQLHVDSEESNGELGFMDDTETKPSEEDDRGIGEILQPDNQGMVLRSGSELKRVKRFLDSRESSHRRSTRLTSLSSADVTNNALEVQEVSREVEQLNSNNNARRTRRPSKSPVRTRLKLGRSTGRPIEIYDESARLVGPQDRHYRLKHMYDLDRTDDFSDSDSYTSSFTSTDSYGMRDRDKKDLSCFTRCLLLIIKMVTTMVDFLNHVVKQVTKPIKTYLLTPVFKPVTKLPVWLWRQADQMVSWLIVLDIWMVSRNSRKNCCLCLPLLILLAFFFAGGYYVTNASPGGLFFMLPSLFPQQKEASNLHQGGNSPHNLHQEVKQIIRQLQAEHQDWLSRADIEALVRGMLNPEMESLRVSVLNMAKEGSSDQTVLKVNQHDSRQRLLALEEQMASLLAKAKILDRDQADMKSLFMGTLTEDRGKQAEDLTTLRESQADLKGQIDSLQSVYNKLAADSKKRCMEESTLKDTIQKHVSLKMAEMMGEGGKFGRDTGDKDFTGWLDHNYVDHSELDQQLRLLMAEVTDKINAGIKSQSSDHSSAFLLSTGKGTVSEESIRLIVEDSLLKYSADRTGLPDFALESAGGSVLNDRCSETYVKKTAVLSVFGIPLFYMSNSPRSIIQPDVHPGQCWAFKGDHGYVMIQLAVPIRPTGFSLEHIPKSLSIHGNVDSAPKDFSVLGLKSESDTAGVNLGNYTYQTVGTPIQHFDVQLRNPGVVAYVELRVLNNHGNKDYTCVYRFRVHGVPQP